MAKESDLGEAGSTPNDGRDGTGSSRRSLTAYFDVRSALQASVPATLGFGEEELSELEHGAVAVLEEAFTAYVEERLPGTAIDDPEWVDRELRRRITADRDGWSDDRYECEGCGFRHYELAAFLSFHDMLLCDGCRAHARDELREIQRPLIEALAEEPTLERARALGFELGRDNEGNLCWTGEDSDDLDEALLPYADEQEALEVLADELSGYLRLIIPGRSRQ